jgi:Ca-activated chloride channel family protein
MKNLEAWKRTTLLAVVLAAAFLPVLSQDASQRRGFSIAITEPANQDIVLGKTRIVAEVKIASVEDVERVEFFVGDELVFVDREAPYECFHDFGEESKSWIVRAVAHHLEEISVSDAIVTRKVSFAYLEEVNRVILWATVTDRKDNLITGLTKDDFTVQEDGKAQRIIEFYPEDRPITMAILLDTSGSMREKMKEVHAAAGAFVETLRPEDRALVIDFDDKVFLIQDLTSDHEPLREAITSTKALGATSIYDALHAAFRKLEGIKGRKAIVLLSDGDDTSSQFGFERVLEEAKGNNVIIYGIGLGGGDRRVLKEFPEVTGGRAFFVGKASQLAGVYERIALELRRQYYLTYSTTNDVWDGRWVKVRVEAKDPAYKVRARRGFFAVQHTAD